MTLRSLRGLPLLLVFPVLPACALSIGAGAAETRETTWPHATETPASVPFAVARKPGQAIRLNPEQAEPIPAEVVPVVPEMLPPTVKVSEPANPPLVMPTPAPDAPLVAILRAYVDGHPEAAMPWIQKLERPNQEMVLQLVPALVKASQLNPALADPVELAMVAGQLASASQSLGRRAPMTIEKALFCRWVKNFGRYDPLPDNPILKPGTTNTIYFEIGNVGSEPSNQNGIDGYLTKLVCSYQVRDSAERPLEITTRTQEVKSEPVETKVDFTLSPLKDYFLQLGFTAPTKPGKYTVHFKVKDSTTGREVLRVLPFRVP